MKNLILALLLAAPAAPSFQVQQAPLTSSGVFTPAPTFQLAPFSFSMPGASFQQPLTPIPAGPGAAFGPIFPPVPQAAPLGTTPPAPATLPNTTPIQIVPQPAAPARP